MTMDIKFKWLDGDALQIIEPILESRGWASMNDKTCRALCAFDGTKLVGFHVFQLYPHAEPMWLDRAYRGTGIAEDMADKMMEFLSQVGVRGFMVIADNPAVQRLCESHGMKKVNAPVYAL